MMAKIGRTLFRGVMIIVPAAITVYVLLYFWQIGETLLRPVIEKGLTDKYKGYYVTGMGVLASVILIFVVGMLWNVWLFRRLFRLLEKLFDHIPLVKTLYGAVRDLLGLFQKSEGPGMSQVVMVKLGDTGLRLLGFVTREDFTAMPKGFADPGSISVYLPLSYALGGFTVMVPRASLESVAMPVEDAMRFAITAGVPPKQLETMVRRKK